MKKKCFTLLEIVVSLVIVGIVFVGLIATFSSVREYIYRANLRLGTVNFTRTHMNSFYPLVGADRWDNQQGNIFAEENPGGIDMDNHAYTAVKSIPGAVRSLDNAGTLAEYREVLIEGVGN